MIEFWWAIWSAWAWWRYQSRKTTMPVLNREDSQALLKSLVESGITEASELESLGVRRVDILEWKEETNRTAQERLETNIESRQYNIINTAL